MGLDQYSPARLFVCVETQCECFSRARAEQAHLNWLGLNRQQISDPAYTVIQAGWGLNNPSGSALEKIIFYLSLGV